jgi:VWFA-related protein
MGMKLRCHQPRRNDSFELGDTMRTKKALIAITICLSAAAFAFAQSAPPLRPPPPPPSQPAPASAAAQSNSSTSPLRVASRLVQVTVTVQDKDGHPVTGLGKDDFKIFDQGRPQEIAGFSSQTSRITADASAPASPNVFSNRTGQPADSQPPLTVIVMDAFQAKFQDRYFCPGITCQLGSMFQQVRKFIDHVGPQDRVAIYEIGEQLYLLQDFTNDADALRRGVDRGAEFAGQITYQWAMCQPLEMQPHTLNALHEIAARLARVPGRKNLIVLSHGFPPIPFRDGGNEITSGNMVKAVRTLGDADLPMTAIDTAGVYSEPIPTGPVPAAAPKGPRSGLGPTPAGGGAGLSACAAPHLNDFDYSRDIANRTGGRVVEQTNDLAGAVRRVMDDYSATYLLSYYPDHNEWNGEFREITVKVERRDVDVHARNGYYAIADTASQMGPQRLADAMSSPLDVTEISFDVQADAIDASGVRQLKLNITFDPAQLHFQQQGNRWTDNIGEFWTTFDAEGKKVDAHSQTLNLKPLSANYQQFLQKPFSYSDTVTIAKGAERLRFMLRDDNSGAIGSVTIPLTRLFASVLETQQTKK